MPRELITLSDLIYAVRDIIGEIKDSYIRRLSETHTSIKEVTVIVPLIGKSYLECCRDRLLRTFDDILDDSIITANKDDTFRSNVSDTIALLERLVTAMPRNGTVSQLLEASAIAKTLYETLEPLASQAVLTDHLTSLYTLYAFNLLASDRIERYLDAASKERRDISIAMFDFNSFKLLNDRTSHAQADVWLKEFAGILSAVPEVVAARRSGDEFLLWIDGPDAEGMDAIIKTRVLASVDNGELFQHVKYTMEQRGEPYNPAFEREGNKISVSAGITSTRLKKEADEQNHVLHRIFSYLPGRDVAGAEGSDARDETRRIIRGGLEGRWDSDSIARFVGQKKLPVFRNSLYSMLVSEAEKAMHYAQNNRVPNNSSVFIYNPSLPSEAYSYVSDGRKR